MIGFGPEKPIVLINCVAYQDGRKLADIQPSEIRAYVSRPECFVWVALWDPSPEELTAMQVEFDLHPLAVEDAHKGHQRPKIEEYGDLLFVVLHLVEMDGAELKVGEVAIFVGTNYVLSVRSRSAHGFVEVRARCEREPDLPAQRLGFRALRHHGCRRRPLLPGAGRPRGRARRDRAAHLRLARQPRDQPGACTASSRS